MLEKPDLRDEAITRVLQDTYGLIIAELRFLPLGADLRTAVYRAEAKDSELYFVKLRSGDFDENTVALPAFLHDAGVDSIIAPLPTRDGQLRSRVEGFTMVTYPYIEGKDGYTVEMNATQWRELGAAFRTIHGAAVPPELRNRLRQETFSPKWREKLRAFLAQGMAVAVAKMFDDAIVREMADFVSGTREQILDVIARAERYARQLQSESPPFVLCHADIHAGNVLIARTGALYIVDWDDPILAPKERDLMFIGGGLWGKWHTAQEEEALFYAGYGQAEINPTALAYYRYERIVEDIVVDCEHITTLAAAREDRAQSLRWLKGNFLPGSTIVRAYAADGGHDNQSSHRLTT